MKMSDIFELPVRRHYSVVVDRNGHQCSYSEQINFAVHAINNHDRLEQENAELKGMLKHLLEHDCINDHKLDREVEKLLNK